MTEFDISAIPDLVNNLLFDGTNETAAQLILSAVMIFTCMLPMMIARQKVEMMMAVMAIVIFAMVAIGWLNELAATVLILIIAAMLAKTLSRWVRG